MRFFSLAFILSFFFLKLLSAEEEKCMPYSYQDPCEEDKKWYGLIGTGYAYSLKAGIENPDPSVWDFAAEGYNNNLGGSPFLSVGFGRSFYYYLRGDVSYTYFQGFHYQKFQSGLSNTANFTGDRRNRYFDVAHQNVMFNCSFYPEKNLYFSFIDLDCSFFLGFGVGAGFYRIFNFHTVGYDNYVGSVTTIGYKVTNSSFAWQGFGGIRLHPTSSCFSLDLGYRYYDGGAFQGPYETYSNDITGLGMGSGSPVWRGRLKTHQLMIDFNFRF